MMLNRNIASHRTAPENPAFVQELLMALSAQQPHLQTFQFAPGASPAGLLPSGASHQTPAQAPSSAAGMAIGGLSNHPNDPRLQVPPGNHMMTAALLSQQHPYFAALHQQQWDQAHSANRSVIGLSGNFVGYPTYLTQPGGSLSNPALNSRDAAAGAIPPGAAMNQSSLFASLLGQSAHLPPMLNSNNNIAQLAQQTGRNDAVAPVEPSDPGPSALTGRPPVCLSIDLDEQTLSPYQTLLRQHIELFETLPEDVRSGVQGRNTPIKIGQVGMRCRHCAHVPKSSGRLKKGTVYYSRTMDGLYQVAQNLSKVHLCKACPNIPEDVKARLCELQQVNRRTSGGREYWLYGLKELGVYEEGNMLRFRPLGFNASNIDASSTTS
jgi:hypothetical protein